MGFFSKLFGKDEAEAPEDESGTPKKAPIHPSVVRLTKKICNKYVQTQERQAAIGALGAIGTSDAVAGLLQRFTFRIEQSIGDEEEKRMVFDDVVRLGPTSVEPLIEFLARENSPYWGCKALREIIGDEASVTHLLQIIDNMEAIFDRDIERKIELVSNLRMFKDPRVRDRLLSFMDDENEELRVHALEGLADLAQEEMAPVFVARLIDENETQRVKTAVLNLLIEKKWKIKGHKEQVRKVIPQTFWIDDVGVIHRR